MGCLLLLYRRRGEGIVGDFVRSVPAASSETLVLVSLTDGLRSDPIKSQRLMLFGDGHRPETFSYNVLNVSDRFPTSMRRRSPHSISLDNDGWVAVSRSTLQIYFLNF